MTDGGAAYAYQVTGQRRGVGESTDQYRQQLCLLGFHLAPAVLDCGTRKFPLGAIPDVDDELRSIAMGGDWGDRGLERINAGAEELPMLAKRMPAASWKTPAPPRRRRNR